MTEEVAGRALAAVVRVVPLEAQQQEAAQALAVRLGVTCERAGVDLARAGFPLALLVSAQGVALQQTGPKAPGAIQVDFSGGKAAHRRKFGGGRGQLIAKAVGLKPGITPRVLDATAGLGRDAFVLATLGCPVLLMERSPVVAELLLDGLRRAALDPDIAEIIGRMRLLPGDATALLQQPEQLPWRPQVIYLDPMFPHRDKSSLVKKEMRVFRQVVGDDADAEALLAAALNVASHRVVVKRPRKAPLIGGVAPTYQLEGKSSRYDIYVHRSLGAED